MQSVEVCRFCQGMDIRLNFEFYDYAKKHSQRSKGEHEFFRCLLTFKVRVATLNSFRNAKSSWRTCSLLPKSAR